MAQIFKGVLNGQGGFHVSNYWRDATTGVIPHPIQAGNIYGPVSFRGSFVNPSVNNNAVPAGARTGYPITSRSGYSFLATSVR